MSLSWIICPTRNNLSLTRAAVETFRRQDIAGGVEILIIDNGSTDGTLEWLQTQHTLFTMMNRPGMSVAASWNRGLETAFCTSAQHALVVNNDVELRHDTYRHLVADGGGFVTAVGTRDRNKLYPNEISAVSGLPVWYAPDPAKKRPHPDFSCFLIRREVYGIVGPFDENFKIAFCEDQDYHVRLHQAGIKAEALELPFLHHASQTVKNADPKERDRIMKQAEANREYFFMKWGVRGGTQEYYDLFGSTAP